MIQIGTKFEVFGMPFHVYKDTGYSVNDLKCYIAAANGIKNIYHQLIVQENGFLYGSHIKVKVINKDVYAETGI